MTKEQLPTPGELYQRALAGETDLYLVRSGPQAKEGWVGIPVSFVEVVPGTKIDVPDMTPFQQFDPQPPQKLTQEELVEGQRKWQEDHAEDQRQKTQELIAITGTHRAISG